MSDAGKGLREGVQDLEEAGRALEAFARTSEMVRSEVERLARTGEMDLDRLVRKLAELVAAMAAQQAGGAIGRGDAVRAFLPPAGEGRGAMSVNRMAALAAQAMRRGARFL